MYVDFKNAFNSVDIGSLWNLLHKRVILARTLSRFWPFTPKLCAFKSGGDASHFISVKSGGSQGCDLATFNTSIGLVMGNPVENTS